MSETISTYRKSVKLRADSIEEARPIRAALDEQVLQAITALTTHEPGLQSSRTSDEGGNCRVHATAKGYDIVVTTRSGQDSVFQGGERRTFISYTLSASSSLRSVNRAVSVSREVSFGLRGIGAITFAALFFWGIDILLRDSGMVFVRFPIAIVVAVVLAGVWLGERLGNAVGTRLESRAWSRAEESGAVQQLELLWRPLEQRFNTLLEPHEHI